MKTINLREHPVNKNRVYWCPSCNRIVKMLADSIDMSIKCEGEDDIEINSIYMNINMTCKHCNADMIELDEKIAPYVIRLNKIEGVTTCFSCEGHVLYNFESHKVQSFLPYICFEGKDLLSKIDIIIHKLTFGEAYELNPGQIKIDTDFDFDGVGIYAYPDDVITKSEDTCTATEYLDMSKEMDIARKHLFLVLDALLNELEAKDKEDS